MTTETDIETFSWLLKTWLANCTIVSSVDGFPLSHGALNFWSTGLVVVMMGSYMVVWKGWQDWQVQRLVGRLCGWLPSCLCIHYSSSVYDDVGQAYLQPTGVADRQQAKPSSYSLQQYSTGCNINWILIYLNLLSYILCVFEATVLKWIPPQMNTEYKEE